MSALTAYDGHLMTIHYHGTPLSPSSELMKLAGKHFCVPFSDGRDADRCLAIGQSVMFDNGAFSAHTRGAPLDIPAFYAWIEPRIAPRIGLSSPTLSTARLSNSARWQRRGRSRVISALRSGTSTCPSTTCWNSPTHGRASVSARPRNTGKSGLRFGRDDVTRHSTNSPSVTDICLGSTCYGASPSAATVGPSLPPIASTSPETSRTGRRARSAWRDG